MKRMIIQYICIFGILPLTYANEHNLLDDFNNNIEFLAKLDSNALNYIPSIQFSTNDKSQVQQEYIENILYNEKLLLQWSKRLSDKYSGHYWVLMTKENKKPILVDIVKIKPTTRIQFSNISMEIIIHKSKGKYDLTIKTSMGKFERIENKNRYDLKSNVTYISSYNIGNKYYWLYSFIVK